MTVEQLIAERPCPCECDGFVQGLRAQLELPEHFPHPTYPAVDGAVLEPLLRWQREVMRGKATPSPESQRRCWCYTFQPHHKPRAKKGRIHGV